MAHKIKLTGKAAAFIMPASTTINFQFMTDTSGISLLALNSLLAT